MCEELILYTSYIHLHIATIYTGSYFEVFLKAFLTISVFHTLERCLLYMGEVLETKTLWIDFKK